MRNLAHLPQPPFPYFTAIVAAKQNPRRQRLQAIAPNIQQSYIGYANNLQNLEQLEQMEMEDQLKKDLEHCYTSATAPLTLLKNAISDHHRATSPAIAALCQYCGLNHDACEFDHYLPKETFAEYSTLSLNLVPSCGRCNLLKGTEWLDANGTRMIVSFYHDTVPDSQFLFAEIEMGAVPLARFRLSNDPADYGGLEQIIRNHFGQLELLDRFSKAAPAFYSEVMGDISPLFQLGDVNGAANILHKKAEDIAERYSPNYWKVALLQAMAENQDFLAVCI